jgi:V/A-type H+-transporting ATPase subunit I
MAMSVGMDSLLAELGAVLILFAGHTLNIVLSAMSVLVHGVRLNALEFSMHLGLEWSGVRYTPFRRVGTLSQV